MGKDLEGSFQCLLKYYASSHLEGQGEPVKSQDSRCSSQYFIQGLSNYKLSLVVLNQPAW
jgi:hypothetical protein